MKILNYLETSPPSLFSFDFFINILVAASGQVPGGGQEKEDILKSRAIDQVSTSPSHVMDSSI